MLKYPKTLVINGAPTPADAALLKPGDEITAWEDGVPQKYVKDAVGGLVVPFSGTAGTNASQIAAQAAADAGNALLPQMTAKIGEVDSAIAGAQATVAGLVAGAEQGTAEALAAAGITRYATLAERDAGLGARQNGDYGAVYLPTGVMFYRVTAGAWVDADSPSLASVEYLDTTTPGPATLPSVDYGQFSPGLVIHSQRYELLSRPPALPVGNLGGTLIEPWQFELDLLPWLEARDYGAGEPFLQVQVFAFCSDAYPLRINFFNTIYSQGLSVDLGTVPADSYAGSGSYLAKRTRRVLLSEATQTGRRGWSRTRVRISAPNGAVELFKLSLIVGWQR